MKHPITCLAFLVALSAPRIASADVKVVTTTPDLASVAAAVGGEHADVTALALPTQDPHFVDARPHLALALSRADLLVVVGLDLEVGWLPTLQTNARNGDIQAGSRGYLDASKHVDRLGVPKTRIDRSMGDVHPGGNPHYMFDPRAALAVARAMAGRMAEIDSDHAEAYRRNLERFESRVRAKLRKWKRAAKALSGEPVVTYHFSFPYLADWLGFEVVSQVEPKPGIPPNPRHVMRVLKRARKRNVGIVLQEGWYPTNASELIADKAGATLVRIPGGPDFKGGESYVHWIDGIVARLVRAAKE
ncbi:MAG: metal ABC transporter substrate-binding protein [Myxococcota bacterium]